MEQWKIIARVPTAAPCISGNLVVNIDSLLTRAGNHISNQVIRLTGPNGRFQVSMQVTHGAQAGLQHFTNSANRRRLVNNNRNRFHNRPHIYQQFLNHNVLLFNVLLFQFILQLTQ